METDTSPADNTRARSEETEAKRLHRVALEAQGIAEADADIAAGRVVDAALVRAWVESIGTNHELPVPYSGR